MRPRVITRYALRTPKIDRPYTLLIVSDLHNEPYDDILSVCSKAELLLIPGDLIHRCLPGKMERGLAFLADVAKRIPTYYTFGNHEDRCDENFAAQVRATGVALLNNAYCRQGQLVIGGIHLFDKPRLLHRHDRRDIGDGGVAAARRTLRAMEEEPGFRLLLSHKPEHFVRHVRSAAIDLTLSGHAHGGQVRILGQGLYAPNQGILPTWTHGFYEEQRLLVSSGAANKAHVPRIANPREVVLLTLEQAQPAKME